MKKTCLAIPLSGSTNKNCGAIRLYSEQALNLPKTQSKVGAFLSLFKQLNGSNLYNNFVAINAYNNVSKQISIYSGVFSL